MFESLLSVVGTTSSGKTTFSLQYADYLCTHTSYSGVAIVSADSRQVYKGLEILSGADIPATFIDKSEPYLKYPFKMSVDGLISIHGVSIIKPSEDWSLAHFATFVHEIAAWCQQKNYFLMVVGGTGLYHQHITPELEKSFIPPNEFVRNKAEKMSVLDIQLWLREINEEILLSMNNSDSRNPRRLVRAIEKELYRLEKGEVEQEQKLSRHITIGLSVDPEMLQIKIADRVKERLKAGVVAEVEYILQTYGSQIAAATTLGFHEVASMSATPLEELVVQWIHKEYKYAKRQLTWWKKHTPHLWIQQPFTDYFSQIRDLIEDSSN